MTKPEQQWVKRWGMEMAATPVLPGVWKKKGGGFVVRARAVNPKTGHMTEIVKALSTETDPKRALAWLTAERDRVRRGEVAGQATRSLPTFSAFAASLLESKVADGTIKTASGRKKWARILEHHLFQSFWASYFVDQVTTADLIDWRNSLAKLGWTRHAYDRAGNARRGRDGKPRVSKSADRYSPTSLNTILSIARVIWKSARLKFGLPVNPMAGVEDFSTDGHRTYTVEEPNALTADEVSLWLATFKKKFPQFYAMTFLGLVLGHRPSTLRPLRRKGPTKDLDFAKGVLLVRRSNTESDEVEDFTKTRRDQTIKLPPVVLDVLRWHIDTQLVTEAMRASDLLFPTREGGFRSRSCLDKPFAAVSKACGITKRITPKALRRTFQVLSLEANMAGAVAKAITGHQTDAMRLLYIENAVEERQVQSAIAKVVNIAAGRRRKQVTG